MPAKATTVENANLALAGETATVAELKKVKVAVQKRRASLKSWDVHDGQAEQIAEMDDLEDRLNQRIREMGKACNQGVAQSLQAIAVLAQSAYVMNHAQGEAAKAEEERLAVEAAKAEEERLAVEAAKAEEEPLAVEAAKAEEERLALEATEAAEAAKAEEERLAVEAAKAEEERLAVEAAEAAEAAKAEEERLAVEAAEAVEAAKAEEERLAVAAAEFAKAEEERITAAKAEEERRAAELRAAIEDSDFSSDVYRGPIKRLKRSQSSDPDTIELEQVGKCIVAEFEAAVEQAKKKMKKQRVETSVEHKSCDVQRHLDYVKRNIYGASAQSYIIWYRQSNDFMQELAKSHEQAAKDIDLFDSELLNEGRLKARKMQELAELMLVLMNHIDRKRRAAIGAEL